MDTGDRAPDLSDDEMGLPKVERSLRRALATTESDETRFHVRTALQYLEVLRADSDDATASSQRPIERP